MALKPGKGVCNARLEREGRGGVACERQRPPVQAVSARARLLWRASITLCSAVKKTGAGTAAAATEPLDADAATWAAVEASHGSLAACSLAHVQALSVASAAAAARFGSGGDAGRGC